jgi:hypothetical protein
VSYSPVPNPFNNLPQCGGFLLKDVFQGNNRIRLHKQGYLLVPETDACRYPAIEFRLAALASATAVKDNYPWL